MGPSNPDVAKVVASLVQRIQDSPSNWVGNHWHWGADTSLWDGGVQIYWDGRQSRAYGPGVEESFLVLNPAEIVHASLQLRNFLGLVEAAVTVVGWGKRSHGEGNRKTNVDKTLSLLLPCCLLVNGCRAKKGLSGYHDLPLIEHSPPTQGQEKGEVGTQGYTGIAPYNNFRPGDKAEGELLEVCLQLLVESLCLWFDIRLAMLTCGNQKESLEGESTERRNSGTKFSDKLSELRPSPTHPCYSKNNWFQKLWELKEGDTYFSMVISLGRSKSMQRCSACK